ncbi:hypothetical protein Leryth_022690 [Lithospermum erythrorhizon]|nr:hypothetical protein Leryth_022690 [Lithospermum erythrorhizon]
MGGNGGGLEEFKPIFVQVNPKWSNNLTQKPFIFHVQTSKLENGNSCICICLTDFHNNTFQAIKNVLELEDMREIVGVGGPWCDFVDYMKDSFTSEDLKLVLEGQSKSGGAVSARVIAQKSDGMPTISVSLSKLVDSAASEAIANITLELFKLYKNEHELLIHGQQSCCQLTNILAAEQERLHVIQGKLDALLAYRALTSVSRREKNHIVERVQGASPASRASTSVTRQEKNPIVQREHDASPASQALTSVSSQEKNQIVQREKDASPTSRALAPVSCKGKNNSIRREQDASQAFRALALVSCQEKNGSIRRELDASASRPQKYRKIADLSSLDAISAESSDKKRAKVTPSSEVTNRVVPAHRRVKVQGTILVDSEDESA